MHFNKIAGVAVATCGVVWSSSSFAQSVVVQPAPTQPPPVVVQQQPPPPPNNVVVQTPPPAAPPPAAPAPAQSVVLDGNGDRPSHRRLLIDRRMFWAGTGTLAIGYGAALVVAGTSDHQGDAAMYLPVFGPWVDLASRGGCRGGPGCDDTGNRAGLVIDGMVQGLGAMLIVGSFLFPEEEIVTVTRTGKAEPPKPAVHVTPASVGRGAPGLAVVGTF